MRDVPFINFVVCITMPLFLHFTIDSSIVTIRRFDTSFVCLFVDMSAFIESPRKGDHPNHFKHDHNMFQVLQSDVSTNGATPVKVASTQGNATYASPGVASALVENGSNGAAAAAETRFAPRGPVLLPYNGYGNGNDQVREAMEWPPETQQHRDDTAARHHHEHPDKAAGLPSALLSQNKRSQRNVMRGHLASSDLFRTFDYPDNRK